MNKPSNAIFQECCHQKDLNVAMMFRIQWRNVHPRIRSQRDERLPRQGGPEFSDYPEATKRETDSLLLDIVASGSSEDISLHS
ncbi:hypothetical protein TNCV_4996001 [Trichonephila clavipes]|nr:hypothetical protein TNCV_4996001 [Trichonephila clavipes]